MANPKISIIVPCGKDRQNELKALKESLQLQTYRNFELIVEIGPHVAANRNNGAKRAKGEILLFIDSDVYLTKNMLKLAVETLEPKSVLVYVKATLFAAIYRKDFIPFDLSFRFAEDNKWFADLEERGVKTVELLENKGNPSLKTQIKKSFYYPMEWKRISGTKIHRVAASLIFDIIKRLTSLAGCVASLFVRD